LLPVITLKGKETKVKNKTLDTFEKNKLLSMQEMTVSLLAKLFLGRAEAKIAKMIGVDDFSV